MSDAIKKNYDKMLDTVKNSINLKKAKLVQLGVFMVGTLMVALLFIWSYLGLANLTKLIFPYLVSFHRKRRFQKLHETCVIENLSNASWVGPA